MLDKNIPGPGKIDITKPFGNDAYKFTMGSRGFDSIRKKNRNDPGPGDYKLISINKDGKYPISNFQNTFAISFGLSKEKRFNYNSKNASPAPNHYNIKGLIDGKGFIFSSKYKSQNANSLVGKGKDISTKFTNYKTPGPGTYRVFSEFGIYEGKPNKQSPSKEK